mgnify:CR=1 FL=1
MHMLHTASQTHTHTHRVSGFVRPKGVTHSHHQPSSGAQEGSKREQGRPDALQLASRDDEDESGHTGVQGCVHVLCVVEYLLMLASPGLVAQICLEAKREEIHERICETDPTN